MRALKAARLCKHTYWLTDCMLVVPFEERLCKMSELRTCQVYTKHFTK